MLLVARSALRKALLTIHRHGLFATPNDNLVFVAAAMACSREHCELMAKVGEVADSLWLKHGDFIAGQKGFKGVNLQSIVLAHPALPIFATALGCMPSLSNGATVNLWGKDDPISLAVLNVNHSQTRKSRLTGVAERLHEPVDELVLEKLKTIHAQKEKHQATMTASSKRRRIDLDDDADAAPVDLPLPTGKSFPGMWSHCFLGGTIERVRERCAGDVAQVHQTKQLAKLPPLSHQYVVENFAEQLSLAEKALCYSPGMAGRLWFSQGLIYDEIYGLLEDLSLLDKPNVKKEGQSSGQTPLAGWFNRLFQMGKSDHETKSNGSHGGSGAPAICVSLIGNLHPTPAIEMIQGLRGDHGCQSKARLCFVTGSPVQPHELYKDVPGVIAGSMWVDVPEVIQTSVGLDRAFASVNGFKTVFDLHDEDSDPDGELPVFYPSPDGIVFDLPDGVATFVRLVFKNGRYVGQWCIADRAVEIPDDLDMFKAAPVLVNEMAKDPHKKLTMTDEARGKFLSYSTYFNIEVKRARDACDSDTGAEYGTSPWKLGMIAASLVLWDVMWNTSVPAFREDLSVHGEHIDRAFTLLKVFWDIRSAWRDGYIAVPVAAETAKEEKVVDKDMLGCPILSCGKTTEIVRRMFGKSDKTDDVTVLHVMVRNTFSIFTRKQQETLKPPSVHDARKILGELPASLGHMDRQKDAFVLTLPDEPSVEYTNALNEWSGLTPTGLKALVASRPRPRGGWGARRASQASQAVAEQAE